MVSAPRRSPRPAAAAEDHPVRLQGLGVSWRPEHPDWGGGSAGPSLCERRDQDFLPAILRELAAGQVPAGVLQPRSASEQLNLLQPVHRRFTVALLEAVCDPFGESQWHPRLNEGRLHSAGLVVRRVVNGVRQGWRSQEDQATGQTLRGWIPFADNAEEDLDPDPSLRPAPLCGHPDLESRLLPQPLRLSETTSALFRAPPAVAAATGRTILYGLVPLTSFEHSELPTAPPPPLEGRSRDDVQSSVAEMLPYFLREGQARPGPSPSASSRIILKAVDLQAPGGLASSQLSPDLKQAVITGVQQLAFHFRVFDSPELMGELERITIDAGTPEAGSLAGFLRQAQKVVIERAVNETLPLPVTWGAIPREQHQRLLALLSQQLQNQIQALAAGEGRFEGSDQLYQARAFVRLHRPDGCPPRIVWSGYSNPFTIAPWYQANDGPPLRIELPDVLDPQTLRSLKPNVAFRVPSRLFKLLGNSPEDLLKGIDRKGSGGPDLEWLCGFNIPIITICAFIVLNLFLVLFNLIFWWIFIIKICIPLPRPRASPPPP